MSGTGVTEDIWSLKKIKAKEGKKGNLSEMEKM